MDAESEYNELVRSLIHITTDYAQIRHERRILRRVLDSKYTQLSRLIDNNQLNDAMKFNMMVECNTLIQVLNGVIEELQDLRQALRGDIIIQNIIIASC